MKLRDHISAIGFTGIIMLLTIVVFPMIISDPAEALLSGISTLSSEHPLYSWVVTGFFVLFGVNSIISGWKHFDGLAFQRFMLTVFGCTFAAAAISGHLVIYENFTVGLPFPLAHRYFAGMAVISFTALATSTALILSDNRGRMISFFSGVAVVFGALIQSESEAYAGLWQRIILVIITGWMIYISKYSEL